MFKKRLSQVLWAIWKWYVVDTAQWGFPIKQEIGVPALATATAVLASTALTASVQIITAWITNPDVLRCVSITWNAAWIVGNVVIKGKDWAGRSITESIAASGTSTVAWVVAFKEIDSVTLPVLDTGGDAISVGVTGSIGLYRDIDADADVLSVYAGGTREAVATVDNINNTITITTAFNGIVRFEVSYLTTTF